MEILTRSIVRAYRQKWIDFLMTKGRKKATGKLDKGNGARCCLGHGAFVLGIPKHKTSSGIYSYDNEKDTAPASMMRMLGLWNDGGDSDSGVKLKIRKFEFGNLAEANDETVIYRNTPVNITPRQIGKYLLSVIEGGEDTPFKPLSDYPE